MKIAIITFSPTGGTMRCAERLAQSIGETVQRIDLTDRNLADYAVADETEIAVVAVPSYGGRVPSLAAERLKKIDAKKCIGCMRCVALCPSQSKRLPAANRLLVHSFLSLTAGKRKEAELFIK